jgi:hypothetical protein
VGRAGRRHRLAVNVTYCRPVSHDQAYFADPLKLLRGRVEPPRFNLSNRLMLAKHVRAAVLTELQSMATGGGDLPEFEQAEVSEALERSFPGRVRAYLFHEDGTIRVDRFQADSLRTVVSKHGERLVDAVGRTFADNWPDTDADVVTEESLRAVVDAMPEALDDAVGRVHTRLHYAHGQMTRLEAERQKKGDLEPDEHALYQRCRNLVQRLKGTARPDRSQPQGYDDAFTYGMLAAEGFLPGYGLETGSVLGIALAPRHLVRAQDLYLPRPVAVAVREYVPGNLVYANGNKFTPRFFHFDEKDDAAVHFQVDPEQGAVQPVKEKADTGYEALGQSALRSVPVCDVELAYVSQITDDEEFRFLMSVAVYGYDQGRHDGGTAYAWGEQGLKFLTGVRLRLVNVGPKNKVEQGELGYPVSLTSGQSRSPFASEAELDRFAEQ